MRTTWNDELTAAMLRNREEGLSLEKNASALSREFGVKVTRGVVMGRVMRLGLATPSPAHRKTNRGHSNLDHRRMKNPTTIREARKAIEKEEEAQSPAVSTCQWPVCDEPFIVCGEPVFKYRQAYCAAHKEIARRKY